MTLFRHVPLTTVVVAMVSAMLLSGCSAFQSSKRMDMSPFSENAGVLFVEAAKVSRPFRWNYNRPHLDSTVMSVMRQKAAMVFDGLDRHRLLLESDRRTEHCQDVGQETE